MPVMSLLGTVAPAALGEFHTLNRRPHIVKYYSHFRLRRHQVNVMYVIRKKRDEEQYSGMEHVLNSTIAGVTHN
ncbi:MAG TPA: hypothetical protein VJ695_04985 [Nitrososphaera sp.]|nr:hypothetical protein [Nitrososphaera sp.]